MKTNVIGSFLILVLLVTACAAQKKAVTERLDVSYVMMKRTSCFGRCPSYSVEVYKDGVVRFTGIRFVKDTGIYEKNLGAERAQKLLASFGSKRVDTLKEEYDVLISDIPGINYGFKYQGGTKDVRNAHFGPKFLKELAKEVDELVRTDEQTFKIDETWKRISEGPKGD